MGTSNQIKHQTAKTKSIWTLILTIVILALSELLYKNSIQDTMFNNISYHIFQIVFIFFIVIKVDRRPISSIDLRLDNVFKQLALGSGLFFIMSLLTLIPFAFTLDYNMFSFNAPTLKSLLYEFLYCVFIIGFTEELIFRGYLLERLKGVFNSNALGIIISSFLFGLVHYDSGGILKIFICTTVGIIICIYKNKFKGTGLIGVAFAHGMNDFYLSALGYIALRFFM